MDRYEQRHRFYWRARDGWLEDSGSAEAIS